MVKQLGKTLASAFSIGGHMLGFKELLDITGKFLEKYKDNPLLRTIIENQFRELREEIVTFQLIQELDAKHREKLLCFFNYLNQRGLIQYVQDIQNVTFSLVIYESIGVPLAKATTADKAEGAPLFILKDAKPKNDDSQSSVRAMKTAEGKKFLEDIANNIGDTGSENDYQKVKEMLMSYRLIGQRIMKTLVGMGIKKAESLLKLSPTTLTFIKEKFTTALKNEFPLDQPGGFGYLAQRRRDKRKNK